MSGVGTTFPQHSSYAIDRWPIFPHSYDPRLQPYSGSVHPIPAYTPYSINPHKLLTPSSATPTTHSSMFNQNLVTNSSLTSVFNSTNDLHPISTTLVQSPSGNNSISTPGGATMDSALHLPVKDIHMRMPVSSITPDVGIRNPGIDLRLPTLHSSRLSQQGTHDDVGLSRTHPAGDIQSQPADIVSSTVPATVDTVSGQKTPPDVSTSIQNDLRLRSFDHFSASAAMPNFSL